MALAVEDRDAVDQAYIEAGRGFRRETYIKRRGGEADYREPIHREIGPVPGWYQIRFGSGGWITLACG